MGAKWGECHLCGVETFLTFEHVPPEAAFNDRPVVNPQFEKIIKLDSLDSLESVSGPQSQRGVGKHTLCGDCNSKTGSWYAPAFVDWAYQGLVMLDRARTAPSLYFTYQIFPLRIIKQVLCMFFSVNSSRFRLVHEDIVRLVLNREFKYMKSGVRIYAGLLPPGRTRQSGVTGLISLDDSSHRLFSEIAFPPFCLVMTLKSEPPDERLVDITHFANYGYNEWTDVSLRLPNLSVYTFLPGDYRDRDTVLKGLTELTESD